MGRGLDAANLDRSVAASDDFYAFANGSWCKNNPLPAEYSRWVRGDGQQRGARARRRARVCSARSAQSARTGARCPNNKLRVACTAAGALRRRVRRVCAQGSFEVLAEENMKVLREVLDAAAAAGAPAGTVTQLVGDFWTAAMDVEAIEAAGAKPLTALLLMAEEAVARRTPMSRALSTLHTAGVPVFFSLGDGPDAKASGRSIAQAHQGGLGLPDRDYYSEPQHAEVKAKYEAHVARMLALLGDSAAEAAEGAAHVVALESRLAAAQWTRTERRDPDRTYNLTTLDALANGGAPGLNWRLYFEAQGKPAPGDINVDCPAALAAAAHAAGNAEPEALRAYLRWHIVNAGAEYLSDAFATADFEFYQQTLSGQKEQKPRWKRIIAKVNAHLGEALGQLYVARAFAGDAKARAAAVVQAVRAALLARLNELPWLADETRQKCGRAEHCHARQQRVRAEPPPRAAHAGRC